MSKKKIFFKKIVFFVDFVTLLSYFYILLYPNRGKNQGCFQFEISFIAHPMHI